MHNKSELTTRQEIFYEINISPSACVWTSVTHQVKHGPVPPACRSKKTPRTAPPSALWENTFAAWRRIYVFWGWSWCRACCTSLTETRVKPVINDLLIYYYCNKNKDKRFVVAWIHKRRKRKEPLTCAAVQGQTVRRVELFNEELREGNFICS